MRHLLPAAVSITLFLSPFFSATSFAGDCNKTVMGGGCAAQVDAGVAPHMHSQSQSNAEAKIKVKANVTASAVKAAAPAKNLKISNATNQKPQI